MPGSIPTDGPGSLNDFKWQPAMGVWQFDMVDSALSFTGLVEHLNVTVDAIPNLSLVGDRGIAVHIDPGESEDFLIDVPFNATNMIVQLTEIKFEKLPDGSALLNGSVDVYLRKDSEPDIGAGSLGYHKSTLDADPTKGEWYGAPPRGELHYGLNELGTDRVAGTPGPDGEIETADDPPPLSEGRWFVTIDNPEITGVDFRLKVIFEYDISLDNTIKLLSAGPEPIDDDIVTTSLLTVTNDFLVGSVEVGVRIDHPRLADLDLHLVSPQGTRLLLSENRGHTNIAYGVTLTEETDTVPVFEDGFESADNDFIDDSAKFHSGWELDSGEVYGYRSGQAGLTAHSGVQFLEMNGLESGTISTNAVTEADKTYRLRFAYAKNPKADEPLEMKVFIGTVTNLTVTASIEGANETLAWELQDVVFTAKSANTRIRFQSLAPDENAVMLDSVRLDEVTSANLYAVFSELENLAKASMKFGDAPYAKEEEQVLFSGFEDAPIGLAKTNDIIDGWTVLNSKVSAGKSRGASGTYFATLTHDSASKAKEGGAIWRDLPTAVGQDYKLIYVTRANGDDAEIVLGGVVTNLVEGAITLTNSIPRSSVWFTNTVEFTAARSSTPLTIRTESAAVQLDTIELIGPGPHNLAEEPLDVLSGERAMGEWTLEVRDHRVGGDPADTDPDIESLLVSWYIKIMGSEAEDTEVEVEVEGGKPYTRDDTAEALEDGKKVRGRIYDNETHYWTVETCSDSTKLTIELSSGKKKNNAKVSLLASYGGFPSGETTADDYVQVDMNDSYFAKLVIGDTGHLPLQPGELLYLTVQKTDTNVTERALYDIAAKWDGDCGGGSPPNTSGGIIRLANATGSESGLAKPGTPARFLWSIPAGTPAALLEASGLTADADIDLISADGLHYRNSIHLGQAPEQIVLREGDMAPSLEGDWVVQVNTVGDAPSGFTLHTTLADEQGHLVSTQPIELEIESQYWPPTVRLDWPSVPGERYLLESSENLIDWAPVHEQTAGSSGLVFHAERLWFGERYYRVKQLTGDR
jgi:subtilisin-like proprotein convertase family protein